MHRFQDNINLGTGETEEDRQQTYTNQGVTVVTTTVDATLDLAASTTWLVRNAADGLILSLFEDSAGSATEVAIGGAFGSGDRHVDTFSVSLANAFNISCEGNDASARTNTISTVNAGAGDSTLNIRADILSIGSISTELGFFAATPIVKPTVSGSAGANAALVSLLTQLATLGLIVDSSS